MTIFCFFPTRSFGMTKKELRLFLESLPRWKLVLRRTEQPPELVGEEGPFCTLLTAEHPVTVLSMARGLHYPDKVPFPHLPLPPPVSCVPWSWDWTAINDNMHIYFKLIWDVLFWMHPISSVQLFFLLNQEWRAEHIA